MDESELRRRALESMLKVKHDLKDGAKVEEGEVDDGDASTIKAAAAKKSKWAVSDELPVADELPVQAKQDEMSHLESLSPSRQVTPTDTPVAALPPPSQPPPAEQRVRSKWAQDEEKEADSKPATTVNASAVPPVAVVTPAAPPAATPAEQKVKSKWAQHEEVEIESKPATTVKASAVPPAAIVTTTAPVAAVTPAAPAAANPPAATPVAGGAKKSRWADDSDDEDATLKTADVATTKAAEEKDFISEARGQGDAMSALDLLEDRLGKRVLSNVNVEGETIGEGEDAGENGDDAMKEEDGAESAEPVEPYDETIEHSQLHRCRDVDKAYQKMNKIDEGTYGVVYRAKCRRTDKIVALKQVKLERAREGFPLTALRELTVLLALRHVNIVHVIEVVVSPKKQVFMAMEYMEHDFRALMESMKSPFRTPHVKCLMRQLLAGVEFMHRHWVIHRDLKTSNLLLDNRGNLKVCDFGLARKYRDPIAAMTPEVVTLWYRAPELLYGEKKYDTKIDMWSVGCIFAELLLHKPLMQGKNEQDQRDKIVELLGTPDEDNWPNFNLLSGAKHVRYKKKQSVLREKIPLYSYTGDPTLSDRGYELLKGLLSYSPKQRLSARESLLDEIGYFDEAPKECKPEHMPTYPSSHEVPKGQKKRVRSPVDTGAAAAFDDDDKRFSRDQ